MLAITICEPESTVLHDSRGVLLHDMSEAEPAWRVAAIVATGILIVASSAVYARASTVNLLAYAYGGSNPSPPTHRKARSPKAGAHCC